MLVMVMPNPPADVATISVVTVIKIVSAVIIAVVIAVVIVAISVMIDIGISRSRRATECYDR
jgi:hypothetical protein